jgi:hypothetical protein
MVWRGFGWMIVFMPVPFIGIFSFLLAGRSENFLWGVAAICAGLPCWFLGRYLRDHYTKVVTDEATGQKVRVRQPFHDLFFIPMHFWAFILPVIGVATIASESLSWKTFASPGGDFSVSAPGQFKQESTKLTDPFGHIIHHQRYFVTVSPLHYEVDRFDYETGTVTADSIESRLDQARDGALARSGGRILSESPLSLGEYKGRDERMQTKDGHIAFVRMYLVADHLYVVAAYTYPVHQSDLSITRFLDSFQLLQMPQ